MIGHRPRALAGALVAFAFLATCAPPKPKYELRLPKLEGKLENGLRVILLPDDTTELVQVDVRYEVGSNEDPAGKAGIAHLVEHLMFQQRPAGPDKPPIWEALRQVAVGMNAYTNWDTTHYISLGQHEKVEDLLAINAARMVLGCKTIPQEQFEREREVVRNEVRLYATMYEEQVQQRLLEAIYPEGHPYRRSIAGDDHQLASVTMDDICKFMSDFYVPERATLIIAGKIDQEEVGRYVRKWFGSIEPRKGAPRAEVPPITLKHRRIDLEMDVEEPAVYVAWALPPRFSPDEEAVPYLMGSMAGMVDWFGDQYNFSTTLGIQQLGGALAPVFVLQVNLRGTGKIDEAIEAVWHASNMAHTGFDVNPFEPSEFEKQQARSISRVVLAFESLGARTNLFGEYVQFDKKQKFFDGELERIKAISGKQVRTFIERSVDKERAVVIVVKPRAGADKYRRAAKAAGSSSELEPVYPVDPAEAAHPLVIPERETPLARARRFKLDNGMRVVLLPLPKETLPIVNVRLIFHVGSGHEDAGHAGLAITAADFLEPPQAGTGAGGRLQSANVLGQVGAEVSTTVTPDYTMFRVRGMSIYMDVLLQGLERLIKVGNYNQEGLDRWHQLFGFIMKRESERTRRLVEQAFETAIYGKKHPYSVTGQPTLKTIGGIGHDAAWKFKENHYRAGNATLVVAGNFDEKYTEYLIRKFYDDWDGSSPDPRITAAPEGRKGPLYVGIPQTRENPNMIIGVAYPAGVGMDGMEPARMILEQMLNERVRVVREKLGASYGTYANREMNRGPGMYRITGFVDSHRAGEAIAAIREGIDGLRKGERFDEDFARARRDVLRQLLVEFTDSSSLASQLATIAAYELPADFFDRLAKQIAAMSPAQVKALIAAELRPETEVTVMLGTKEQIEKAHQVAKLPAPTWVTE